MKAFFLNFIIFCSVLASNAQVTQWRGTNRDGHFNETGLLKEWPENGPVLLLQIEKIGKGYSSPILVDNIIYVTGMIDTLDYLSAIDMQGNLKWQVPYGRSWNKSFPDTRSTPTIEGNRIYVQSGTGKLSCINRETGQTIWSAEVDKDFEGEYHTWGNSETPLIVDNKVICTPGGKQTAVVALDKMSGQTIWKTQSLGGPRAYASATLFKHGGQDYILAVTATHLMAIVPETGEFAWHYNYSRLKKGFNEGLIWTNIPVVQDNRIFLTMGYDYPAVMLEVDSTVTGVSEIFVDNTLDNHHHGVILHDGHVYGSNWYNNKQGRWVCMKWETGEIKYVDEWDTKGAVVMADEMLYAYNERGNVGLIKPDPDGFQLVSEFKITEGAGPHWAHPFIADGKLLMRHGEVVMVYAIKK